MTPTCRKSRFSSALPVALILPVLLICATMADAQETQPSTPYPAGDGESVPEAPKVRITKKDCNRLVRYQASAGVAYQQGVDVRGNPVAPADAGGGFTIPLPDVYEFAITKDLSAYLDGPEEQLAADKAAAIAAEKSVAATKAAVESAESAVTSAETVYQDALADATAAQAAADAAPNDAALATAAAEAQAEADAAATGLTTTQSAYTAAQTAATSDDVSGAVTAAKTALSAAQVTAQAAGLDADAVATTTADASTAVSTAEQAAQDATAADAAALAAAETVAKSSGMTLNVGTVRYNINTGSMTFNGKPLNDSSEADLAALCQTMLKAK
ncbi:MAG: hypothetical protein RH946_18690 [Rhodospirillales bacterium]